MPCRESLVPQSTSSHSRSSRTSPPSSTRCRTRANSFAPPSRGVGDELTKLVQQHPLCVCAGCGVKEPRPCHTPGHCDEDPRVHAFERWGIFYCEACGAQVAFCTSCYKPLGKAKKKVAGRCDDC